MVIPRLIAQTDEILYFAKKLEEIRLFRGARNRKEN